MKLITLLILALSSITLAINPFTDATTNNPAHFEVLMDCIWSAHEYFACSILQTAAAQPRSIDKYMKIRMHCVRGAYHEPLQCGELEIDFESEVRSDIERDIKLVVLGV